MKFRELKKSLAEKVEPIYLACGDDAFFVENAARLICERCVTMPEINLTRFESSVVKEDFDRFNFQLSVYERKTGCSSERVLSVTVGIE